jgi:hypothetical protein
MIVKIFLNIFRTPKISLFFFLGVLIGIYASNYFTNRKFHANKESSNLRQQNDAMSFYDANLSEKLFNEIKVLCMIMTNPKNHKSKAIHVKKTWGKRW